MNYLAVKDLKAPRYVRERLSADGEVMVMNNGKPMALMLDIREGDDPAVLLDAIREARARIALSRMRAAARHRGSAGLSLDQINTEIAAARRARRSRA